MPTIRFLPHDKTIPAEPGERLIRAAMRAGVHINASCGGEGVCGKCRIYLESGNVEGGLSERVRPEEAAAGLRLACRSRISGDVVVRVPVESRMNTGALSRAPGRFAARVPRFSAENLKSGDRSFPLPVEKRAISPPVPAHDDNRPDAERLVQELRRDGKTGRIHLGLPILRQLPDLLRQNGFRVSVTLRHPISECGRTEILRVESGDTPVRHYGVAVDIGTTTVQGRLLDLTTGASLAEAGTFNAQISYGEDVISRIMFSEKGDGLALLHRAVTDTVNGILSELRTLSGVDREDIAVISLAGNTTMTQLLLGIPPRHVRLSPYVPATRLYPPLRAAHLGLELPDHAAALVFPQVSSYVGGDIVAGVLASGIHRSERLSLFLDIGTNAEIVVGSREWLVCAACSAGPAFEGGGIEFGMRAAPGAIEDFSIDPISLEPMNLTVADERPAGICGSGLINIVAALFVAGVIDNRGRFDTQRKTPRIRQRNDVYEYVLAFSENTLIGRDISISEIDIDNLIRAKGAIFSGCQTLLASVGLSLDDLDRVILAGGFGSYVNLRQAMAIGLLPEMDTEKIRFIGNASLTGASMCTLSNPMRREAMRVLEMMTNFELSETPSYMDHYVAALFLPHTDLERFPLLRERMRENGTAAGNGNSSSS